MRIGLVLLTGILGGLGTVTAEDARCCFTNPAYSGICEVTPAEGETCQSILDYLNAPNSSGRSYCGGTQIRGGWALSSCAHAEPKGGASGL